MAENNKKNIDGLLKDSQVFACEYQENLSNHLPMALIALDKIGATKNQLYDFYQNYVPILEKQTADFIKIDSQNWISFLGEHRYNSAYREFFLREIQNKGMHSTLTYFLEKLIPGLSGAAFHPLIRLAYAIQINSEWEIAEALASWCMAYQELGDVKAENNSYPPVKLLETLKVLAEKTLSQSSTFQDGTVFAALKGVADTKAFTDFFNTLNLNNITIGEVADAALRIYLSTNDNFTALHCVTSTHALRILNSYFKGTIHLKYIWQSVCAAYVITGCVPLLSFSDKKNYPEWNQIFSVTQSHKNDHVIKLVYTAYEEFLIYKNPLYIECAARKTKLI